MGNILEEIAEKTRKRVERLKEEKPADIVEQEAYSMGSYTGFPFESALSGKGISFICEVKKASPSKGLIAADFPYVEIARQYEAAGASAISVLTEPEYFLGSSRYLQEIAQAVNIPILRKDFTVDEYQIYEAKILGASAVLLICAILSKDQIVKYIHIADTLGLSALVEAHDAAEVKTAIECGARVIGVNNRNLKDFSVDINNSAALRKMVPENIIFVSESGIRTHEDVRKLVSDKADAVLIGELLMRSDNKAELLQELKTGRKTRVKICGLSRDEDIDYINGMPDDMRPDYAGFVFAESSRQVTKQRAETMRKLLDERVKSAGVFVDEPVEHVAELANGGVIDMVQLHGHESNDYIMQLRKLSDGIKIIKAVRVRSAEDIKKAEEYCSDYLLLDAYSGKSAGGNGETFDWSMIKDIRKPYFLAGGLCSENVKEAVEMLHPFAVDVSSGVETEGNKDTGKIKAFMKEVR